MARMLPAALSAYLADIHRSNGVDIRLAYGISRVEPTAEGIVISGPEGDFVADVVLIGVGAEPNVALAQKAGLTLVAGGIAVDASGRTSEPDIFAAGDCAALPGAHGGGHVRYENWTHARDHARAAARAMLGQEASYQPVPWVWTDQYDLNIQVTGRADSDELVFRGDPASHKFTVFHLDKGRIVGATTVNEGRNKRHIARLVAARAQVDPVSLADDKVPIVSL